MSLRKAVDAKCRECIYDGGSGGGTWRQQVTACTSPKCPLFPVRPLAGGVDRGLAAKSILVLENGQFAPVPGRDREEH